MRHEPEPCSRGRREAVETATGAGNAPRDARMFERGKSRRARDRRRSVEYKRHRPLRPRPILLRRDPDEPIAPDEIAALVACPAFAKDDIEFAAVEAIHQHRAQRDREFEFDKRMLRDKALKHFRQPCGHEIFRRAEPQTAALFRAGEIIRGTRIRLQNIAREFDKRFAFRCHRDRMCVPNKQPMADAFFELLYMLAHRRLAQVKATARFGEAVAFSNDQECLKQNRIEHLLSEVAITLSGFYGVPRGEGNRHSGRDR